MSKPRGRPPLPPEDDALFEEVYSEFEREFEALDFTPRVIQTKSAREPLLPNQECPCGCGYQQADLIRGEIWRMKREAASWKPYPDQTFTSHTFKDGQPPPRIYRIGVHNEGRARRKGLPWDTIDLLLVYKHHKGICGVCGEPVSLEEFTIDHEVPLVKGGGHVWENLQLAHGPCNSRKWAHCV